MPKKSGKILVFPSRIDVPRAFEGILESNLDKQIRMMISEVSERMGSESITISFLDTRKSYDLMSKTYRQRHLICPFYKACNNKVASGDTPRFDLFSPRDIEEGSPTDECLKSGKSVISQDVSGGTILVTPIFTVEKEFIIGFLEAHLQRGKCPEGKPRLRSSDQIISEMLSWSISSIYRNYELNKKIEGLFESFVKSSISAIEARDPTTAGHSERVAILTIRMAETVNRIDNGPLRLVQFTDKQLKEIRYASLLHDMGKIAVSEELLLKGHKLFAHELQNILTRIELLQSRHEVQTLRKTLDQLLSSRVVLSEKKRVALESELAYRLDRFRRNTSAIREGILLANESQVFHADLDIEKLIHEIRQLTFEINQEVLTESEIIKLSVPRGTLSKEERLVVETHVTYTTKFLKQISWTDDLKNVPDIAGSHHEKLDGTGYPKHLKGDDIPVQSQMMTICDIYDALTAIDRPYKKPVSAQRALDILSMEVKGGKLNSSLFDIFIDTEIYKASSTYVRKAS